MKASILVNFPTPKELESLLIEAKKLERLQNLFYSTSDKSTELIIFCSNTGDNPKIEEIIKSSCNKILEYDPEKDAVTPQENNHKIQYNITGVICKEPVNEGQAKNILIKQVAIGEYLFPCHYDIQTTFTIINAMIWHFEANNEIKEKKVASISACTQDKDRVEQEQYIELQANFTGTIIQFATEVYNNYLGKLRLSGLQRHLFSCIPRKVYEDIGEFNEKYLHSGYDLEWSGRAMEKGYLLVTALDSYVHHDGVDNPFTLREKVETKIFARATLGKRQNNEQYNNRFVFIVIANSDTTYNGNNKQLIDDVCEQLVNAGIDKIVIYNIGLNNAIRESMKILNQRQYKNKLDFKTRNPNAKPDEKEEFSQLIQYVQKKYNPKWIGFLDQGEMFGQEFDSKMLDKIYNCPDPNIYAYGLPIMFHYIDNENIRMDGAWGNSWETRIYRNLEGFNEVYKLTDHKLYAEKSPNFPQSMITPLNCRIRCFGFVTPEQRQQRFTDYIKKDFLLKNKAYPPTDKNSLKEFEQIKKEYYFLLKSKHQEIVPYVEKNDIAGIIPSYSKVDKTEEWTIIKAFNSIWGACKQLYLQEQHCTDKTLEIAELFGAKVYSVSKKYPDLFYPPADDCAFMLNNFAKGANLYKEYTQERWILKISADEYLKRKNDTTLIVKYSNKAYHAVYFHITNLLKKQGEFHDQNRINLFQNIPEFYYTRKIHETHHECIELHSEMLDGVNPFDAVEVTHVGYLKKSEHLNKKFRILYHRLNKLAYKEDKNDGVAAFNLGIEELTDGNKTRAMQYFKEAIKRDPNFTQSYFHMFALQVDDAKGYAQSYVDKMKFERDNVRAFLNEWLEIMKGMHMRTLSSQDSEEKIVQIKI